MKRTIRVIIAVIFVCVIMVCAISISHHLGKSLRLDVTERKLYTLSAGTGTILGKLREPIKMKLFYAKTAVRKAPDQFKAYNSYYYFVESLLKEYATASNRMVELEIIDPRPYSDDESAALRYGLQKFPLAGEENFFFGLAVQTRYGAVKAIPFLSPSRQNFLEYDVTYLIDTVTARQKKRIGILSSLPVMGDEASSYLAQMMAMQGQQPRPAWAIIEQLRQQYEVGRIETTAEEIKDVDILLIIHPKNLGEKLLFAIDQFVLKGGRTIVLVDPFSMVDQPNEVERRMMKEKPRQNSDLNRLLKNWGVEMPEKTIAGDRSLALVAAFRPDIKPTKIIGLLKLTGECMNRESVISADLNQVHVLFAGVLFPTPQDPKDTAHRIQLTPLIQTTDRGNAFKHNILETMVYYEPETLMKQFVEGKAPAVMGYQLRGRFRSNFPAGIDATADEKKPEDSQPPTSAPGGEKKAAAKRITGLKEASQECVVVVFSDVDFISDFIAYQKTSFGSSLFGDNVALLMNTIEDMAGSSDLIAMRSRGGFQRPFLVVDRIEQESEKQTAQEDEKIKAEIAGFRKELETLVEQSRQSDAQLLEQTILDKKRAIEMNIRTAQRKLRNVNMERRKSIEELGGRLRNINVWSVPILILLIATVLGIRRNLRRRQYVSHASDS